MFTHKLKYYNPETDVELDLEVHYEVDPYEPETYDSPGCEGSITIYKIFHNKIDITKEFKDLTKIECEIIDYLIMKAEDDKIDAAERFFDLDK